MMRAVFLLLAVAYVTAIPSGDVVPEEALVEYQSDYNNAKAHLQTLLQGGKSDKECRDLATDAKKAVKDDVDKDQKVLDALPDGSKCKNEGQGLVSSNKASRDKANQDESDAKKKLDKAKAVNVDFGSMPYNTLVPGQCGTFFNHANYKAAQSALDAAQKAHDKAKGAKVAAQKAYDDAVAAATKAKDECLCRTKKEHDKAWASVKKSIPNAGVDWKTAHNLLCVLDGTPASKCMVPPEPKVTEPKIIAAAKAMDGTKCSAGLVGYCSDKKSSKDLLCIDFEGGQDFKAEGFHASGGHIKYRCPQPTLVSGSECRNGQGTCLKLGGCTAYGDLFSTQTVSGCQGNGCTLTFWYTGQLYVGSSQSIPGSNGHGHSHNWIGDSGSKDAGAGVWKKATYKISPYSTAHVMFEAFGTSPKQYGFCSRTIIDDVLVTKP